ncbi:hypothetical protein WICPIJ_006573 [Wickerhamomyces pijperi]|uniref:Uncharacterized protein n=1 Tax=Wickerhamomyces pijperi TaxID=599730 RepID=A0A9P8Q3R8_WICPI|nr:hypothetical protein WICPIJ_006573 [Wickerhamomyces pijperi]
MCLARCSDLVKVILHPGNPRHWNVLPDLVLFLELLDLPLCVAVAPELDEVGPPKLEPMFPSVSDCPSAEGDLTGDFDWSDGIGMGCDGWVIGWQVYMSCSY